MNDKVSAEPSAFSAATQILDWQIDWWDGKVPLPHSFPICCHRSKIAAAIHL